MTHLSQFHVLDTGGYLWIGANDLENEGTYEFVDAEGALTIFNWDAYHYSYPLGVTPDARDCIRLWNDNALSMCDYMCSVTAYMNPLCEADLV